MKTLLFVSALSLPLFGWGGEPEPSSLDEMGAELEKAVEEMGAEIEDAAEELEQAMEEIGEELSNALEGVELPE